MKRLAIFLVICLLFITSLSLAPRSFASSAQAYQDYLYQFDIYRQAFNEFNIAKNQYQKFNSLSSQQEAITKTRQMLASRDQLLRSYLLLLNQKISETTQLTPTETNLYQTLLTNEISFLDSQTQFVTSVQTIEDANRASQQLESHYIVLQTSMMQAILGITLAQARGLGNEYSDQMVTAKALIDQVKPELSLDQQTILDRWFLQVSNKRTLFLSDQDAISQAITALQGDTSDQLTTKFSAIQKQISDAESELTEGNSYMKELINEMRYIN